MYKHHSMPINHHQLHHQMHQMHQSEHLCVCNKMMVSALIVCSFVRGICIGMYLGRD